MRRHRPPSLITILRFGWDVPQYVVRYRSELDYLPPGAYPGQSLEVSREKHVLYAKIPGNKDARMSIIQREELKGEECRSGK